MILWKNKKSIDHFWLEKVPSLELSLKTIQTVLALKIPPGKNETSHFSLTDQRSIKLIITQLSTYCSYMSQTACIIPRQCLA